MRKKIAIIGDGKMASDCLAAVASRQGIYMCAYVFHRESDWTAPSSLTKGARAVIACENVNEPKVVDLLRRQSPDIIANVNSFDILRNPILNIASDCVVNFHNGPLPKYRGMNIPTWAIFNGENQHGVTWHIVERTIDTGAILAQEKFPIDSNETGISLTFKCIAAGVRQFVKMVDEYAETGVLVGMPQTGASSSYLRSDVPNNGYLNFSWPREKLLRFVRSMTFRPFPNRELRMRFQIGDQDIFPGIVDISDSLAIEAPSGTIISVSDEQIAIATRDSIINIQDLMNIDGEPISTTSLPISPGYVLN